MDVVFRNGFPESDSCGDCWRREDIYNVRSHQIVLNRRSLVIDHLHPQTNSLNHVKTGVAHFYFDQNDRIHQKAVHVIRCLLKQLVFQLDSVPNALESTYDLFLQNDGQEPEKELFNVLLEKVKIG